MAESPTKSGDGVLKVSVLSDGESLDDEVLPTRIEVTHSINKIPFATLTFLDGDMPKKDFPISNQDLLKPGKEITINAGYGQQEKTIFKGIIYKHSISIFGQNESRLIVECKDKAVAMTMVRQNENHLKAKDSDIFSKLIGNYSGLSADVEATKTKYEELVQYYCTDWDFLLTRAEMNGFLVCVESGKITVKPPQVSQSPELKVTYGQDLISFKADLNASHQFASVTGICWDPKTQAVVEETVKPQSLNAQGDIDSAELAKILTQTPYRLQTPIPMEKTALKEWATSQQIKSGLSRIRGRMSFQGNEKAKIGTLLEVEGVGNRFKGKVFVSTVRHIIEGGFWTTEVEFGMDPQGFSEKRDIMAPPATGLIPGVDGLQIGVVMKLDEDPEKQNRIQVSVPVSQAKTQGVWARLATYYASEGVGNFFIPEIGDEVILGYLNNDPSNPVILGSVYSSKKKPPYDLTAENFKKAIVTKSELKIEFDDENKITTIVTPSKNTIILSDKDKSITLEDMNKNKVELSPSGISLDSPKDISITAKGGITLDATGKISITSKADVSIEGMNVNQQAKVNMVSKGTASAEFSASGQTVVKGAMVMIN